MAKTRTPKASPAKPAPLKSAPTPGKAPKKNKSKVPPPPPVVAKSKAKTPAYVPKDTAAPKVKPVARPKRLSKSQLAKEADTQLRDNARELLQKWYSAVKRNLDDGDPRAIEMVGRMFQYDKGPGGVTIFNQHLQVNGAATEAPSRVRSFDQIVGKLEEQDGLARSNRLAISAPIGNSEDDIEEDDDIVDAELVES